MRIFRAISRIYFIAFCALSLFHSSQSYADGLGANAIPLAINNPQPQSITFGSVPAQTFGNTPFTITATAPGGPVTFPTTSNSAICTVSGSTVTIVSAGICSVEGYQSGGGLYQPTSAWDGITIAKAAQTIAINSIPTQTYGNADFSVSATATSGAAVTFSSGGTGICTVSGNTVHIVTAGSCTVLANQSGTTNYNAAPQASKAVTINKENQSISFPTIPTQISGSSLQLSATATSGLNVSYTASPSATCTIVNGTTLNSVLHGSCTITAIQSGNTNYLAATTVVQQVTILDPQSINFGPLPNVVYNSGSINLSATATSNLPVSFSSSTTNNCSVSGSAVSLKQGGTCTILAAQNGNATYAAATVVPQTFQITPAPQSINFTPGNVPFGTPPYLLQASATSGLAVAFSSNSTTVCFIDANNQVNLVGVGSCSITASQVGSNSYQGAAQVTASFIVTDVATTDAAVGIAPPYLSNADAGTLPGRLSVNNTGAATYSMPIALPPGTNGMEPKLSLDYSSLAGNGLPGYGWSLAGGSSVHRCVRTAAQDGTAAPVALATTDALCLDGKRLLLVGTGTYGAVGSTYRTEIDNFARITMVSKNGITGFTVETKDGRTMTYGTTADSAVQAIGVKDATNTAVPPGNLPPLFWDLSSITDSQVNSNAPNNRILFSYSQNQTTGEHLLSAIQYGNNSTLNNSVTFTYECRNGVSESNAYSACSAGAISVGDADIAYVAGARSDMRHRIKAISTYTDASGGAGTGTLVQTTTLSYQYSATSHRSLLTSVQACAGSTCLPATNFTWGTGAAANSSYSMNTFVSHGLMTSGPPMVGVEFNTDTIDVNMVGNTGVDFQKRVASLVTGDFYGNGKQSILTADQGEGGAGPAGLHVYTVTANGTGFTRLDLPYSSIPNLSYYLDFGVPDPSGTFPQNNYLQPNLIVGDFDGDGATDFAFIDTEGVFNLDSKYGGSGNLYVCLSRLSSKGTFDCKVMSGPNPTLNSIQQTTYTNDLANYAITTGTQVHHTIAGVALNTQGTGRSDLMIYDSADVSSQRDSRCSYVPPSSSTTDDWSLNCVNYPGVNQTTNSVKSIHTIPYSAYSNNFWPIQANDGTHSPGPSSQDNVNIVMLDSAFAPSNFTGDYFGSHQTGFIGLAVNYLGPPLAPTLLAYMPLSSPIISTTAPSNEFSTVVGGIIPGVGSPSNNKLVWNVNANMVNQVVQRFFIRESRGTELTGSSLGDLNGDGDTDYLFTFEGHSEICYSTGSGGYDCRLMEDMTPNSYSPTITSYKQSCIYCVPTETTATNVQIGSTISANGSGVIPDPINGYGIFSVMTIGRGTDTNLSEVIYRRGDGGAFNGGLGGAGGDQYYVCIVRDGQKSCAAWVGPKLRPYISGASNLAMPIPGVTYTADLVNGNSSTSTLNWPTAGTISGDFTGHGRTEFLWYCASACGNSNSGATGDASAPGWQIFTPNVSGSVDRLIKVVNGVGNTVNVAYKPMADSTVYTPIATDLKTGASIQPNYPVVPMVDNGRLLVSQLSVDAGSGNFVNSTYQYQGLGVDNTGRGEQGFAVVVSTDPFGTVTSSQYAQGFPYTGMMVAHKVVSSSATGGVLLNSSQLTNYSVSTNLQSGATVTGPITGAIPTGGYSYCSFVHSSQSQSADLDGSPLASVSNLTNSVDGYCNVLSASSTNTTPTITVNGLSVQGVVNTTTTTNTINNQTGAAQTWVIGEVSQSVVNKTESLNNTSITRTKAFTYYPNGTLQFDIVEPTDTTNNYYLKTYYDRGTSSTCSTAGNSFGLVNCVTQTWTPPGGSQKTRTAKSMTYDGNGRFLKSTSNALGQTETYVFDSSTGAMTQKTDINGLITKWNLNGFGRILSEVRPDHTQTNFYQKQVSGIVVQSNESPVMVKIVDHVTDSTLNGKRISVPELEYVDSAGHAIRHQSYGFSGQEIDTDATFDADGRLLTTFLPTYAGTSAVAASTNATIDVLGRVTAAKVWDDQGNLFSTSTAYHGLARILTNAKNQQRTEVLNGLGQVVQVTDSMGYLTKFSRDAFQNLLVATDPLSNQIVVSYDLLGRKIQLNDPDLGIISYGIDARGLQYNEVSPVERANGQSTTMIYDDLDRLTQKNEPDLTSTWIYDVPVGQPNSNCLAILSCGKLIESYSTLLGGSKDYDRLQAYDNLGRPSITTTTLDTVYTSTFNYDEFGRPFSTIRARNGSTGQLTKQIGQVYNQFGYLSEIVRGTGTSAQVIWQSQAQDAGNRVTQAMLGNGLYSNRIYSAYTGRLSTGCLSIGVNATCATSSAELLQEGYTFDVLGNVLTRNQMWDPTLSNANGVLETFTYDNLNRISTSQVNTELPLASPAQQPLQQFTYDGAGNILSKTGVGTGNYQYPGNGTSQVLPHAVSSIPGIGNFSYDANGNLKSGNGRTTSWTSFDMPNTITEGANSSTFVYGPEHQRVTQRRADMTLVYSDGMETDVNASTGAVTVKTYWPAGLGFDTDTLDSTGASTGTTLTWVHEDRLGSVIGYSNQSGALVETLGYDVWGYRRNLNGTAVAVGFVDSVDNKGFTGQEMLDQLGLVHMNGRVYDPLIGRFMSGDPLVQDPTHSQSYNRYAYVWNNPTNLTDPTGFETNENADSTQQQTDQTKNEQKEIKLKKTTSTGSNIARADGGVGSAFTVTGAAFVSIGSVAVDFHSNLLEAESKQNQTGNMGASTQVPGGADQKQKDTPSSAAGNKDGVSVLTYAKLSNGIYDTSFTGTDGFSMMPETLVDDPKTGLRTAVFTNGTNNVMVFAGTSPTSWANWSANLTQAFGFESAQYSQGMQLAKNYYEEYDGNLSFTGHSLGGGIASASAIVTGGRAVTFNAAGVNDNTLNGILRSHGTVTSYYSSLDVLHFINFITPNSTSVPGQRISVGAAGFHGMGSILNALGGGP